MRKIAIYVGRFQPFHKGHYSAYKFLVDKFGEENVFIGTSNPEETDPKNPFNFQEKQHIMHAIFDIPSERIVQVKNPYKPVEILSKFDPKQTSFITAVGEKDGERLSHGKYFKKFDDEKTLAPYESEGYFITVPNFKLDGEVMSSTRIRDFLGNPARSMDEKIDFFKKLYGKFNPKLFNFVQKNIETNVNKITPQQQSKEEEPKGNKRDSSILQKKVRNPQTRRDILVKTALQYDKTHPAYKLAKKMFQQGSVNEIFEPILLENAIINQFNSLVDQFITGEDKRKECRIEITDSIQDIEKKCKKAYKRGVFYYPLLYSLQTSKSDEVPNNDTSMKPPVDNVDEAMSSTERVRKYYKRHPDKVKKYLKKTQNDRVARNRDRAKAVKKHGKSKMKNHDVHHPNGPHGGSWKLAKKDHGRDKKKINELFLLEGGSAGHLRSPYEDVNLTFGQYKDIISRGLIGDLGAEEPVTEKLDGQNIGFTVINGEIKFARNKGHVKNSGRNSMTIKDLIQKFQDRGNIQKAFVGAARDLQATIHALPKNVVEDMFGNGRKYMSTEIILPDTQNVIPYDKSVLVFHGTIEYDDSGEKISTNMNDALVFDKHVKKIGQHKQKVFGLQGPNIISFSDKNVDEMKEKTQQYHNEIDQLQQKFGLNDNDLVSEYYKKWWQKEIISQMKQNNIKIDVELVDGLVRRLAFDDTTVKIKDVKDQKTKMWLSDYIKDKLFNSRKRAQRPFELLFLKVGADSLNRVEGLLGANSPHAAKELQDELTRIENELKNGNLNDVADKLEYEFQRLGEIGIDKLVPSEGVVFMYNGQPYKFTGTFAPINQILGTFKFGRKDKPQTPEPKKSKDDLKNDDPKQFIKQFYGEKIKNPETGADITIKSALSYDKNHPAYKLATQFLQNKIKNRG